MEVRADRRRDASGRMTVAVVLAGGTGTRLGHHEPKQFLELAGRTILEHSVAAFEAAEEIDEIVVVSVGEHLDRVRAMFAESAKVVAVVAGGATRTESTASAMAAVADRGDNTKLLIHDAARPLVSQRIIAECVRALDTADAVATVVELTDTIYAIEGDRLIDSPARSGFRRAQTPQGFRLGMLREAMEQQRASGQIDATDDITAILTHLPAATIAMVAGEASNLKVTESADVAVAELLFRGRFAD